MPQSLSKVYVHIVFSTKDRHPFLDISISQELYKYLGGICKNMECWPVEIGGHRDHVHILCTLSRTVTQSKLLEELKKNSSKWIKTKEAKFAKFSWQRGYAIFSVNANDPSGLILYIQNQEEHHSQYNYQTELRKFFKRYKMDYDERYVWD
jgi:REP element-mobilizing transposase RayT